MDVEKENNFALLPEKFSSYENSKIVLIPVPFDGTVSYGTGTSKGPAALIKASQYLELYDEVLKKTSVEMGICTLKPIKPKKESKDVTEQVEKAVLQVLSDKKLPVVIGGEHSVSAGAFFAMQEIYKDFSVLQLDAHTDLRDEYHGNKHSHACVMCGAKEKGIHTVHVGTRSLSDEEAGLIMTEKIDVFFAHEIMNKNDPNNNDNWMNEAISKLKNKVYVTFDVDAFDPSIIMSTGTPEPGGLDWYTVTTFLSKVFREKEIIGFDIVELAPIKGVNAPDFTAAKLLYRMIGLLKG